MNESETRGLRAGTPPQAPPWARALLVLFFLAAAAVIGECWLRLPAAPWPLLIGALATVLVVQRRALLFAPGHLADSLGSAAALAAVLCLAPAISPIDAAVNERWTVLATGFALLAAPLIGGLWTTLLAALAGWRRACRDAPAGRCGQSARRDAVWSLAGLAAVHVIVVELTVLGTFSWR